MEGLLGQGLELMVYGMGTVVVFLTLLVFATRTMSLIVLRFFPEPAVVQEPAPDPVPASAGPSPAQLAAITAAVHHHRQLRS